MMRKLAMVELFSTRSSLVIALLGRRTTGSL